MRSARRWADLTVKLPEVCERSRQGVCPVATAGSITGMKLSLSIPSEDVAFLDAYAAEHALGSRSAAMHQAIGALRLSALPGSYAEAWSEWMTGEDAEAWETTAGDGGA
jgi:hypothetical protein